MLDDFLIHVFHKGDTLEAYKMFGAHFETNEHRKGVRFTVYAPNARSVQVIGEFNDWDGKDHQMEKYTDGGIWTLFVPGVKENTLYKYRIETQNYATVDRADPYAFYSELRPGTASRVYNIEHFHWADKKWMNNRTENFDKPMNIYEINMGSWKMKKDFSDNEYGEFYTYEEMIDLLIPYLLENNYTHLEIMPLTEFPFDGSWGYQVTGYYSITSRYGDPKGLMAFINACHKAGIGVIMDYVPAHYVKDGHGLYKFDGGFVYDYPDINRRYTEWDSVYFDVGREEVRSFLMSSVAYLAEYFHIDGIRFDAISNLIYWKGNKDLGVNIGAHEFMKRMNNQMKAFYPGVMLIAEDSTDYPNVTKPVDDGGLGFDYKWDLGWMNDTLRYLSLDPIYRKYDHNLLTFSMAYFYSEKFILPFSHDEVVHGKKTIVDKLWGESEQKFAQLKSLYTYMMIHPGKKLNFMGNELGEYKEWDEKVSLGWEILKYPIHDSFHQFMIKLNEIYRDYPCMSQQDYDFEGFEWLVVDDNNQSVFAIERKDSKGNSLIAVMNFTENKHEGYKIPVNQPGSYKEILNSDRDIYTGTNFINKRALRTKKGKLLNKDYYITVKIAPFSSMIFEYKPSKK